MSTVFEVWTNGSCQPNPGPGGWGYTTKINGGRWAEDFGGEIATTNNRMEMTAILRALQALPAAAEAIVYSDSQYCVNGLTVWCRGWARLDWRKRGVDIKNRDLWLALEVEKRRVRAQFRWVRGHNGNVGNERADVLANMGRTVA